jgi:hypothetical protein
MGDLAFLNLLREKVRQMGAEEKRAVAFGPSRSASFVPWIMPAQGVGGGALRSGSGAAEMR